MIINNIDQSLFTKIVSSFSDDWRYYAHKLRYYKWEKLYFSKFWGEKSNIPLFHIVEIETINRCNATCSFCPANKHADIRELKIMDEGLFLNIIDQLKKLDFRGKISLFSNNEPFLDNRIVDFVKIAKESLPNAFHFLYTNGTLLTLEKFTAVIDHLDGLVIDNYNDKLELNKTTEVIHNYCKVNPLLDKKVKIVLRKQNEILTSRGGLAPNKQNVKYVDLPCLLPFRQLVIRPDGKISLCCNDVYGKYTLGDLSKQSIREIWESDLYQEIRTKLVTTKRQNLELCHQCDTTLFM